MFTKAQLTLTLFYSFLFLVFFWIFSICVYTWMNRELGQGYISLVEKQHERSQGESPVIIPGTTTTVVTVAGNVALAKLKTILVALNASLLLIIPPISWMLAARTLVPIRDALISQRRFVSDASHELRTPLSVMSGEMEVALSKQRSSNFYRQTLVSVKEEIDRLTRLVKNLLFLARGSQGNDEIKEGPVDLTDVAISVITHLAPKYTKKRIHIELIPAEISSVVKGNSALLEQLVYNLVDNAVSYTATDGIVKIKLKHRGTNISLSVLDTGIGIAKKDQKFIFERFYRVDTARSDVQGHGLGLAICKAIVDRHRGTINLTSSLGRGSKFTVWLPRWL
ncbi:MAG: HAMP domain-containing sensor histidine kinase [Patescibacteria group bacterium]